MTMTLTLSCILRQSMYCYTCKKEGNNKECSLHCGVTSLYEILLYTCSETRTYSLSIYKLVIARQEVDWRIS